MHQLEGGVSWINESYLLSIVGGLFSGIDYGASLEVAGMEWVNNKELGPMHYDIRFQFVLH